MTCIVAVAKDEHVWMAGDLMGSNGFTKKVYSDTKVFVNGDFIIGYCGSFRMGQILQYNWEQPPRIEGLTDRQYLQTDVIESMRNCLAQFGVGEFKEGEHQGGNFLIGYRGGIYEMQNNFSILKNDDFAAIGSGTYHAEAALKVLTEVPDFDPAYVLQKAIEVAGEFTTSVSKECTIVSTDEEAIDELAESEEDQALTIDKFDKLVKEDPEALKDILFGVDPDKIVEQQLSEIMGDPIPLKQLTCLDKDTLIKVIRGELSEDEWDMLFPEEEEEEQFEDEPNYIDVERTTDIEELKEVAKNCKLKYPHNIGIEKLREKILKHLDLLES
ncbi:peptidase HslV family [Vibrio phage 166E36-1]